MTKSFLDEILTHLMKVDVLSLAEKIKLKETGGPSDQVSALIRAVSVKEKGSDVLLNFIKASDCQVAQLILLHGKTTHTQQRESMFECDWYSKEAHSVQSFPLENVVIQTQQPSQTFPFLQTPW